MNQIDQAKAHLKEHKLSEALECCEQCEESEEKSELRQKILKYKEINRRIGEACVLGRDGYCCIKRKPDVAIEKLTKAIEVAFDQSVADYIDECVPNDVRRTCVDLDRTELYTWRAEAYLEKNDYDAAIADFTKVIEHFDPPMLNFHAGSCYYQRAETYLKKGCYDIAIEELAKFKLMTDGKVSFNWNSEILTISAEAYFEKAKSSFESGDYGFSYECCEKALEMLQNDWSELWRHVKGKHSPEDSWEHCRYKKIEGLKKEIVELKASIAELQ